MTTKYKSLFLIITFTIFAAAVSLASIILQPGNNDVSIKINNESNIDFAKIKVIVDKNTLPQGINISCSSKSIDVAAKDKSQQGLLLHINVSEDVQKGNYKIPFSLNDGENHVWNYSLDAEVEIVTPKKYELEQNYPNPFNAVTKINYALKDKQTTQLIIFNVLGEYIRTIINKRQAAGNYAVIWNGKDETGNTVPSGIYFYKIKAGSFISMKKMMLLK